MGLSSLKVDSYRAFGLPAVLTLRPLTLVFGHNSRGKSALVRALPLLAASSAKDSPGPLNTNSPAVRGATFAEIKAQHHLSPTVGFELEWSDTRAPIRRLRLRILGGGARGLEYIEQMEAYDHEGKSYLKLLLKNDAHSLYDIDLAGADNSLSDVLLEFEGLLPRVRGRALSPAVTSALEDVRARLEALHDQVHWLEAVRELPERRGSLKGKPVPISSTGAHTADHLVFSLSGDRAVLEEVSAFYRAATEHDLHINPVTVEGITQFVVTLSSLHGPPIRVNILDTGEGMAQVLPVIVLGAMAKLGALGEDPIIVIEHPELHLHPRAHQEVARFLCGVASARPDARVVIETHSENFLSEVQLAVLNGSLASENVALNWVWTHKEGSAVQLLDMDSFARIDAWPPGVFSEDSELKRRILTARRQKLEREGRGEEA